MLKKAETGVSRSAATDFAIGTSVASCSRHTFLNSAYVSI